jgi:hypothetical protein
MVESDQTTQFKFRYVFDVYVGTNPPLRFKTPPNPEGKGLIDVSPLCQSDLQIPQNLPFLSDTPFYSGDYLASKVYILLGEEYSTTATGTPVLYNGLGAAGEPAYGLYANGDFRPAPNSTSPVIVWASAQSPEKYYTYLATAGEDILQYEMGLGGITPDTGGKFLTNCPDNPQTIRSDEDFTLTWLNYNFETEQLYGEVPYAMRLTLYDDNNYIGYSDYYNTPAEGGTGWSTCSTWGGLTGDNYWLQSFKINPLDVDSYTQATGCVVLNLAANDAVTIYHVAGGVWPDAGLTYFSGYLVG